MKDNQLMTTRAKKAKSTASGAHERSARADATNWAERRTSQRHSVLLNATVRTDRVERQVRVCNVSAGGLMAKTDAPLETGAGILVLLRNCEPIWGSVAWFRRGAFGIAFDDPIDVDLVKVPGGWAQHAGFASTAFN